LILDLLDEVGLRRRRLSIAPLIAAVQPVLEHVDGGSSRTDNTLPEEC